MSTAFSRNITEFVARTKVSADLVLRKLALDCLRGVILKSPVDTGRFRASWRVGVNVIDSSVAAKGTVASGALETKGQIGGAKKALKDARAAQLVEANALIEGAQFGDAIFVTNNLPYAQRLEDGWSMQAPTGMVKNTVEEVTAAFDETVRSVVGGGTP